MDYFSPSLTLMHQEVMSIQEMISLDCDPKLDDGLDTFSDVDSDKIHHANLDQFLMNDYRDSLDCFPLDSCEFDPMKWLSDGVSDVDSLLSSNLDTENTNPNLMVNPQTVMPLHGYSHSNQSSGIATPPLTPSTPSKTNIKIEFPTVPSPFNTSNSPQVTTISNIQNQQSRQQNVQFVKVNNMSPFRANSTPLRCQSSQLSHSPSPRVTKLPSPAVRALYREINNPSRNNPILLGQLQNPVQSAIKAAQNIAALNNQFTSPTMNTNTNNNNNSNYNYFAVKSNNQRNSNQDRVYKKPIFSYSCLIAMALKNSKAGSLPVSEIYNFMITHFPYFKTAPGGWKNSVRHNLSLNKCFEKVDNPNLSSNAKKGCLWGLNPAKIAKLAEEITKWRKKDPESVHNSMSDPAKMDLIEQGKAGSPPPLNERCTPKPTLPSCPSPLHSQSPIPKFSGLICLPKTCKEEVMDTGLNDLASLHTDPVLAELSAQWDEDLTNELTLGSLPSSPVCASPLPSNRTYNCITSSSYLNVNSSPVNHYYTMDTTPSKHLHSQCQTPSRSISAL